MQFNPDAVITLLATISYSIVAVALVAAAAHVRNGTTPVSSDVDCVAVTGQHVHQLACLR